MFYCHYQYVYAAVLVYVVAAVTAMTPSEATASNPAAATAAIPVLTPAAGFEYMKQRQVSKFICVLMDRVKHVYEQSACL